MSEKLTYLLQRLMRKTWVRCMLFSLFAVLAVGLAMLLGPSIPKDVALKLGSDSIENLLNILAASMLTVAIFSASTMVSSFSAGSPNQRTIRSPCGSTDTTSSGTIPSRRQ